MKKIYHHISVCLFALILFLLQGCSKELAPAISTNNENTKAVDGVGPLILAGQCPYPCTNVICKGYSSGYCGINVALVLQGDSSSSNKTFMTNLFNSLTNVNFAELSSEMGLSQSITANSIDFGGAVLTYDANNDNPLAQALSCGFYQNSNSKQINYSFSYLTNGSTSVPVIVKAVTNNYFVVYSLLTGNEYTMTNYTSPTSWAMSLKTGNYMGGISGAVATNELGVISDKTCSGQNVMNCMTDAYTNHGWISVWISVQTAFIPATAAAMAGACAALNCL
jgi:hypothetical protein